MTKTTMFLGLTLLLSGCMTLQYKPGEYPIADGKISSFDARGKVEVENRQQNLSKRTLFDNGAVKVEGNLKSISDTLAGQLRNEISKHRLTKNTGSTKNIGIEVTHFNGTPGAFHMKSSMDVDVYLGNGQKIYVNVSHGSPAGYERAMNGTIALGVIEILKNPEVLQYLSSD